MLQAPSFVTETLENSYAKHHYGWASDITDLSPSQKHSSLLLLGAPSPVRFGTLFSSSLGGRETKKELMVSEEREMGR